VQLPEVVPSGHFPTEVQVFVVLAVFAKVVAEEVEEQVLSKTEAKLRQLAKEVV